MLYAQLHVSELIFFVIYYDPGREGSPPIGYDILFAPPFLLAAA